MQNDDSIVPFELPTCFGVFWTESDAVPVAVFKDKKEAEIFAERMHVADDGDEPCAHLDNGDLCVLPCSINGTFLNRYPAHQPKPVAGWAR